MSRNPGNTQLFLHDVLRRGLLGDDDGWVLLFGGANGAIK